MPPKFHIKTAPVLPRRPRVGKFGVVDWREDCANCHNCVKKACVFDRYRQEAQYIKGLDEVNSLFFECMGCFSCVQRCTKGILALTINPEYEKLGNEYYTPDIIATTWTQAENAKIPVSGAGYRGRFSGKGFDSMWTDMSEIVRPTRDGIHGREYISTSVDIGRKPPVLDFTGEGLSGGLPPLVDITMPIVLDVMPADYRIPRLVPIMLKTAARTGTLAIVDWRDRDKLGDDFKDYLSSAMFYLDENMPEPPDEILCKTKIVEIPATGDVAGRISDIKKRYPGLVVAVRLELDARGEKLAIELAEMPALEALHLVADVNGNQKGVEKPEFVKDMVRRIHTALVKKGTRDEITLLAGGGIALAEHLAKQLLCGSDVVSLDLPLLIALECRLCRECRSEENCPARINQVTDDYGVGRMTNLIAAWHDQLIEVMGAMGIRDARRLRGEAGRALFFEDLEEDTFGKLFGSRKKN